MRKKSGGSHAQRLETYRIETANHAIAAWQVGNHRSDFVYSGAVHGQQLNGLRAR